MIQLQLAKVSKDIKDIFFEVDDSVEIGVFEQVDLAIKFPSRDGVVGHIKKKITYAILPSKISLWEFFANSQHTKNDQAQSNP